MPPARLHKNHDMGVIQVGESSHVRRPVLADPEVVGSADAAMYRFFGGLDRELEEEVEDRTETAGC